MLDGATAANAFHAPLKTRRSATKHYLGTAHDITRPRNTLFLYLKLLIPFLKKILHIFWHINKLTQSHTLKRNTGICCASNSAPSQNDLPASFFIQKYPLLIWLCIHFLQFRPRRRGRPVYQRKGRTPPAVASNLNLWPSLPLLLPPDPSGSFSFS